MGGQRGIFSSSLSPSFLPFLPFLASLLSLSPSLPPSHLSFPLSFSYSGVFPSFIPSFLCVLFVVLSPVALGVRLGCLRFFLFPKVQLYCCELCSYNCFCYGTKRQRFWIIICLFLFVSRFFFSPPNFLFYLFSDLCVYAF